MITIGNTSPSTTHPGTRHRDVRVRRPMVLPALLAAAMTLLLFAGSVRGQVPAAIDDLATEFRTAHDVPGLAVGVVTPEGDTLMSYGVASEAGGAAVDTETRFEVGSLSKVFTGLLLADMAVRGEVALDDALSRHLPEEVGAPAYQGTEPTLHQLSIHTSGLPRLPENLAPANMADPYADYTSDAMFEFLSGYALPRAPGTQFEYSNLGTGLLGHLLAIRAGATYPDLLEERVTGPLGLGASYVPVGDHATDERMAEGHAGGQVVSNWNMGTLAGAGAIRSTSADMLRFLRAQLDPDATPLAEAIRLSQEVEPVMDGLFMGLGWHAADLPDGISIYWHNGGTGGFRAFAGFAPDRGVGVVVLANAAVPLEAIDQVGVRMMMAAMEQ